MIKPSNPELVQAIEYYKMLQERNGGNPYVGGDLRGLLRTAGFSEAQTAAIASKILASYLEEKRPKYKLQLIEDETQGQTIELPAIALYMLLEFLMHAARRKAVELNPINEEITISQAANILGVSRSYLVEKMYSGEIPLNTEKSKYGLFYQDVIDYKNNRDSQRMKVLEELAAEAQI